MTATFPRGSYSTVPGMDMYQFDLSVPVEGLRGGWQGRMIENYRLLPREAREGYLFALRLIASAEQRPPAYYRSLPIARLVRQLSDVIRECEAMSEPTD